MLPYTLGKFCTELYEIGKYIIYNFMVLILEMDISKMFYGNIAITHG